MSSGHKKTVVRRSFNKLLKSCRLVKGIAGKIKQNIYSKCAKYPRVLQLPITYACNFDCVMCGIREVKEKDFTPEELKTILNDKLFRNIISVGINGGEPFMKKNLPDLILAAAETLPKLKNIYIITNGYFVDNIKNMLPKIKSVCDSKQVKLNIAVSVDAIGKKLDFHRGKECAEQVEKTVDFLLSGSGKTCYNNMNIICTITKYNVYDLPEVEVWAKIKHLDVEYNIAVYHERINNASKFEDFTIFNDELARQMAEEFFYKKFRQTLSEKYFCNYYFLKNKERIASCDYQSNLGVTLTPNKQLAYCATYSKELGDASVTSAGVLYRENISYRKTLVEEKCKTCSHYSNSTNIRGFGIYFSELLRSVRLFH